MTGKIIWWDLRTPDVEAARNFYGTLLGWTFEDFEFGLVVKHEGESVGMISAVDPGQASAAGTVLYAHVEDLGSAVATVNDLGGRVIAGPIEDNDGGLFVDILDPTGVRVGLWSRLPR